MTNVIFYNPVREYLYTAIDFKQQYYDTSKNSSC